MKKYLLLLAYLISIPCVLAQGTERTNTTGTPAYPSPGDYIVREIGPHHRVWERVTLWTNEVR